MVSDSTPLLVSKLVCLEQVCTQCEMSADIDEVCQRRGMRKHSFLDEPIGDLLSYLCELRLWVSKIVAIAHIARVFDSQFI